MQIIAGKFRHRKLTSPTGNKTRPTASHLRESFFNICQNYIQDAVFLDLFAGSGMIGFEALSRGASSCLFVESDKKAIRCLLQNIEILNVEGQTQILTKDAFRSLDSLKKNHSKFDIIFADPPYYTTEQTTSQISLEVIKWIDQNDLLTPSGFLFVEEALAFQPQIEDLKTLKLKSSRRFSNTVLQQYQAFST